MTYKRDDTYSGWTQDIIRMVDELHQRGYGTIRIQKDGWTIHASRDPEEGNDE